MKALIKCLENNTTLRELDLSGNMLSSETGSRIITSVTYKARRQVDMARGQIPFFLQCFHVPRLLCRLWFLRLAGEL
jgi:hypothetical protein